MTNISHAAPAGPGSHNQFNINPAIVPRTVLLFSCQLVMTYEGGYVHGRVGCRSGGW